MAQIEILSIGATQDMKNVPPRMPLLIVKASINNSSKTKVVLKKRDHQGADPSILLLDFVETESETTVENPQEVEHQERVSFIEELRSIEFFFEGEKIKEIHDITRIDGDGPGF